MIVLRALNLMLVKLLNFRYSCVAENLKKNLYRIVDYKQKINCILHAMMIDPFSSFHLFILYGSEYDIAKNYIFIIFEIVTETADGDFQTVLNILICENIPLFIISWTGKSL